MIFSHLTHILCWIMIVNSTIKNVRAISFDDIFEYFLDGIDDSDESSEEIANSNVNVTCKNCTLSVECHNCTSSPKDTPSTIPMTSSTENSQKLTTLSLPTPTIPAPERVVEIMSSAPQSLSPTTPVGSAAPSINTKPDTTLTQTANTKSIENENRVTDDDSAMLTTDPVLNSSDDGVTSGNDITTK